MKKHIVYALCLAIWATAAQAADIIGDSDSIPAGASTVIDDFERGNYWIWAAFDWELYGPAKLSTSARISNRWAAGGKQSLECKMMPSYPDSATDGMYYMDYHWDFSGARYMVIDINNPEEQDFSISLALQTTDDWKWDELTTVRITPGTHTVVFDLSEYAADLFLVRRINICYREIEPLEGHFFVDNLRIIR